MVDYKIDKLHFSMIVKLLYLLMLWTLIDCQEGSPNFLYDVKQQDYDCPNKGPISCSLVTIQHYRAIDLNYIQVPEKGIAPVFFEKQLHWEFQGTYLVEFNVRGNKHHGYIVLVQGKNQYGFGFMEFDGDRYSFEPRDHAYMILKRWGKDYKNKNLREYTEALKYP